MACRHARAWVSELHMAPEYSRIDCPDCGLMLVVLTWPEIRRMRELDEPVCHRAVPPDWARKLIADAIVARVRV